MEILDSPPITSTPSSQYVAEFVSRGLIVLAPESLGVPPATHKRIFEQELAAFRHKTRITAELIPDILAITNSPGVREACERLLGPNYAIVPFTHNTPFISGSNDQHWHKDDNGPYNMRKQRHHQAVQIEMLYYPQDVREDMGPTATVPYSQYWTFNHEENHDNFAGADHLDFAYHLSGMERVPISGPRSEYALADIVNRTTDHDVRMREAVSNLAWPLCRPFEVGPLKAGSVVLYSHNLIHRGNHRRDDWRTWKDNPRFMWRFWLYRTTEPGGSRDISLPNLGPLPFDALTGQKIEHVPDCVATVWRYHYRWTLTGRGSTSRTSDLEREQVGINTLRGQIVAKGDTNEPVRIGAAYRLAEHVDRTRALEILKVGLYSDRENVRRAALYGLIAVGEDATNALLSGIESRARWVRKAATFGLGSAGTLEASTAIALGKRLLNDPSVYVRSVAADALGCFGRRALGSQVDHIECLIGQCTLDLVRSLRKEKNRLSMDRAQGRHIKMVRPHDDCDVCEGIGFDYGQARYEPVRSVVRENALWALVILCSHGADKIGTALSDLIKCLKMVLATDRNVFCVGLAMDALQRLVSVPTSNMDPALKRLREEIDDLFRQSPIYSLEALVASGMNVEKAVRLYARPHQDVGAT